jgi:drug/metabolite transporter (DMT)-like permease
MPADALPFLYQGADMPSWVPSAVAITATVGFTAAAQLILRWQVERVGAPESGVSALLAWFYAMLTNPWILSVFAGAVLASLSWFYALSKVPLSIAYPFVALTFPVVTFGSSILFGDPANWRTAVAMALIVAGLVINSQ